MFLSSIFLSLVRLLSNFAGRGNLAGCASRAGSTGQTDCRGPATCGESAQCNGDQWADVRNSLVTRQAAVSLRDATVTTGLTPTVRKPLGKLQ